MTKGEICVLLKEFNDSQNGQLNLDSRITQEKIADLIINRLNQEQEMNKNIDERYINK